MRSILKNADKEIKVHFSREIFKIWAKLFHFLSDFDHISFSQNLDDEDQHWFIESVPKSETDSEISYCNKK